MTQGIKWTDRTVLCLTGQDCRSFLQDLISNDVAGAEGGLIYAALLSPQGKYLFDFFVFAEDDAWFIDVKTDRAAALAQRLGLYKLRADVTITASDRDVAQIWDRDAGFADPRDVTLGRRVYGDAGPFQSAPDWDALRVAAVIPETGIELIADDSYILEMGFERLNGVDFKKGCYVGQEVTARMKHKTTLRKGLVAVTVSGAAVQGAEIRAGEKTAGQLHTVAGDRGIAFVRHDRTTADMTAGQAVINII